MQYSPTTINLDTITLGDNPRLPNNLDIPALAENIGEMGLLQPISVWQKGDAYEVVQGHRRTMACQTLKDESPEVFAAKFPDGNIPVFVINDVTAEEVVVLKLDHSGQKQLSNPHEVQMSANMLFAIGKTEAEVAFQLSGLIDKISPMKSKAVVALDELKGKQTDAKTAKAKEAAEKEVKKFISEYRRGLVQNLHNVYRSPHIVMAALYCKACGVVPKGFEKEYLPKLTSGQVKSLWNAHKKDLEVKDEETGTPKYSKTRIGPHFSEKWGSIVKDEKDAGDKPEKIRPKAMSANDMKKEVDEGRWTCVGFCKLSSWHAGDKEITGLDELNMAYRNLDLVLKYTPDLAEMVAAEGASIEARLVEEDKAAKGAAEETDG